MRRKAAPAAFALLLLGTFSCATPPAGSNETHWYRGNTHAHTLWDNGDAAPELVAGWYKSHGYHFAVLSDHNENNALSGDERWWETSERGCFRLQTFDEIARSVDEPGRFLLMKGEEIGDQFHGKMVHHTSINHDRIILPPGGSSVRDVMERAIGSLRAEERFSNRPMLLQLNHPNLGWAVTPEDVAAVTDERFVEVYNGNRVVPNQGDAAHPGMEAFWDRVLALRLDRGEALLYGVACDDAHEYSGGHGSSPGRGWIMVRAAELSADAIVRAMLSGDFYASTGIELLDLGRDQEGMSLTIAPRPGASYVTRFIGARRDSREVGVVLQEIRGTSAHYRFRGDERYVRATVVSDRRPSDPYQEGEVEVAWTQPVRVDARAKP